MRYKALITDFDNTLVGRDCVLSQKVIEAVRKLIETKHIFTIATGRPYFGRELKEIADFIALLQYKKKMSS